MEKMKAIVVGAPKFSCGKLFASPGLLQNVPTEELAIALQRHLRGDWGQCSEFDWNENDYALREGNLRLFSVYRTKEGVKFWIITEADRSSTTALLPSEY